MSVFAYFCDFLLRVVERARSAMRACALQRSCSCLVCYSIRLDFPLYSRSVARCMLGRFSRRARFSNYSCERF